jgi:hypothetical protein
MRNYWIKIVAGALGIFAVGMLGITGFRTVRGKVVDTINSTDPIPIPVIGLVPFKLDNEKLGSVSRVEFTRSEPERVSGVRVLVKLADSIRPERLGNCQLALDDVDNIGERTTFRCEPTTGPVAGLEPFGVVIIKNSTDTFPLLLPAKAVADLRSTHIRLNKHGLQVGSDGDGFQAAFSERTDSIRESLEARVEARGDSVDSLKELSDQLEDSASNVPAAQRRRVQRSADSARTLMRAMIERMKGDEARLNALEEVSGLTPAERDSLARLGPMIRDSVQRMVAQELQKVQIQLDQSRRSGTTSVDTRVERTNPPPAAPAPGTPAPPARPR